jgi:hypothetical protein
MASEIKYLFMTAFQKNNAKVVESATRENNVASSALKPSPR